jgi:hypothetical protein
MKKRGYDIANIISNIITAKLMAINFYQPFNSMLQTMSTGTLSYPANIYLVF